MPTLIDAMYMTLSLDQSQFVKGQKAATDSFTKTKNEATKSLGSVEDAGKKAAESLHKVAGEALDLFAIFLGGRGVKEFVQDITKTDAALGRLGVALNTSPQLISAWGAAVERMGGSSAATAGSFQSLSDKIQALQTKGEALPQAFYLIDAAGQKAGLRQIELNKGLGQTFNDLAADLAEIAKTDPAKANWLGRQLGIDPDTVNLMIKNGAQVGRIAQELEHLAPTPEQIKAAQDMQAAWTGLQQEMTSLAREIWTDLAPSLVPLLGTIKDMVVAIHDVIHGHEGWVQAASLLFALWTGSKFIRFLGSIIALKDALLGVSAANSLIGTGGLLAFLMANPWIAGAAAAAAVLAPTEANGGEDERARQREHGQGGSGNDALRRRGRESKSEMPLGSSAGNLSKLIDQEAKRAGIDPRILEGVRAGESGHGRNYDIGDVNDGGAFGPFQFNMGKGRFGDQFKRDTGLDPRDPKTVPAQTRYMAEFLARQIKADPNYASGGRGSRLHAVWHGYAGPRDPNPRWGDAGYVPTPGYQPKTESSPAVPSAWSGGLGGARASFGAPQAASLNSIANNTHASTSSTSNQMHIAGGIHVNAPNATDSHGIASSIDTALANNMFAASANYGPD